MKNGKHSLQVGDIEQVRKYAEYYKENIAQFREWKLEQGMKYDSWSAYRCTCFEFFFMYSDKVLNKKNYEATTVSDEDIRSISKKLIEKNREAYEVLEKK